MRNAQTNPAINGQIRHKTQSQPVLVRDAQGRRDLGQVLVDDGAISAPQLMRALQVQRAERGTLGDILVAQGVMTAAAMADHLADYVDAPRLDGDALAPDVRLIDRLGVRRCLGLNCLPLRQIGGVTLVATANPLDFARIRPELEASFGPVRMGILALDELQARLAQLRRTQLRTYAQTCVPERDSCRNMGGRAVRLVLGLALAALLFAAWLVPLATLWTLTCVAILSLILSGLLKLLALASFGWRLPPHNIAPDLPANVTRLPVREWPVISILVPLYKEPETVPRLINRLSRLSYPRHLLDVLLVVEERDVLTRAALEQTLLPRWMRVIAVPDAPLRTKPRALNYATCFARGSLIGVYDAEDAPDPDQLHQVAQCFADSPPDLACIQGVLDFYNPTTNWLSRCFTIDYASWFRVVLPGLERLGLVVPLGGTTLFFRRSALEALGGWDAHNVTEDADLGLRLARRGYKMRILPIVTYEEANCRVIPWIRQRSRWLKGYAMTWAVHMRNPAQLCRDLGPWRFAGVQVLFLGTLVQFALSPILWSFWLLLLGLSHPLVVNQPALINAFFAAFLISEVITVTIGMTALRARHHRSLIFWLPALHLYFPLAVIAVYKALWELMSAPFYWDKTTHGQHAAALDACKVHSQN